MCRLPCKVYVEMFYIYIIIDAMLYSQKFNLIFVYFYELQYIAIDKETSDSVALCLLCNISSTTFIIKALMTVHFKFISYVYILTIILFIYH